MEGYPYKEVSKNGGVKGVSDVIKKVSSSINEINDDIDTTDNGEVNNAAGYNSYSTFKVAKTNLPEKTSFWTKVKNVLFYEIKVELTPYQQKIEDEINEFLHQEITWKSLKEAALSEVPITFRGKRIF